MILLSLWSKSSAIVDVVLDGWLSLHCLLRPFSYLSFSLPSFAFSSSAPSLSSLSAYLALSLTSLTNTRFNYRLVTF